MLEPGRHGQEQRIGNTIVERIIGEHRTSSFLSGWTGERKIATMMDSAAARKMLIDIFESCLAHRRSAVDEEATLSDLSQRVLLFDNDPDEG